MEPLQIALAMRPPKGSAARECRAEFSTSRTDYPHGYQHKLLINNNLRYSIIYNELGECGGMSHRQGRTRLASATSYGVFPPFKARRIFFIVESFFWRGTATESPP